MPQHCQCRKITHASHRLDCECGDSRALALYLRMSAPTQYCALIVLFSALFSSLFRS
jgi:hypothetical protein